MSFGKNLTIILFFVFTIATMLQMALGRPHIRHHRGGSHCSKCGPGWGVINHCTRGRDTLCGECPSGTYSPHHSSQPCWICSRCGPGLYEAHACNSTADTVCDSCHRRSSENPDYQHKCRSRKSFFLAPEDALSTGEESVLVNESDDRYHAANRDEILREDVEAELDVNETDSLQKL